MKKQLLEYLVRQCAREVLKQINEADDIKGSSAPPADGQGIADQPEIPKNNPDEPTEPSQEETPEVPPSPELKGVVIVNPKNKSKLERVFLKSSNDADIERELHRIGVRYAGPKVKTSISTMRAVKDVIRNPSTTIYLYVGKYDPNSEEIFLMNDKSIQVAKDESIPSSEITGAEISPLSTPSSWSDSSNWQQKLATQGRTPRYGINEQKMKNIISKMVNEILDKK